MNLKCHQVLDACFDENRNQTSKGNTTKNLGEVHRIALNILKEDPNVAGSLRAKQYRAFMTCCYREHILFLA